MDIFFGDCLKLFDGTIFKNITEYSTFKVTLDAGGPGYFDFIVPTSALDKFNWDELRTVTEDLLRKNICLHWYLSNKYQKDFIDQLIQSNQYSIESEAFMVGNCDQLNVISEDCNIETLSETTLDDFVEIAEICFPDYTNNRSYAKRFCKLEADNMQRESKCRNVILKVNNENVAIGCMIYSMSLNLAYFHNFATLPQFRRKGYFGVLKKLLLNEAMRVGINRFFAINSIGSGSYKANILFGWLEYDVFSYLNKIDKID